MAEQPIKKEATISFKDPRGEEHKFVKPTIEQMFLWGQVFQNLGIEINQITAAKIWLDSGGYDVLHGWFIPRTWQARIEWQGKPQTKT